MKQDLAQKAVSSALSGHWEEALEINKQILKESPKDVDALNRLARTYAELGNLTKARTTAKKVVKLDQFNSIAVKSLEKWKGLKKGETTASGPSSARAFLEEPGKTKIVSLLHLGDAKTIAKLDSGDEVKLNIHSHRVSITTSDGKYIGRLADDLSARLKKLIGYGNEYQAYVKSTDKNDVKIFIRETHRSPELSDIPSFSTDKIDYISFTPPELVHKKDVISPEAEEEE
ncbi:tetratricopeptide repeat protein [Patescibacteria group bacterium]|nr:tetratricopeptide repeat protein [Patescibacteria group bacterium]